jgi:hypothetical protein
MCGNISAETGRSDMSNALKRPRGRPPKPDEERKRGNLTMRSRDVTRIALEEAAAANQRSLSEECEARLEHSLRDQRLFDEAIDTECGQGTAGILALLREIIRRVASDCLPFVGAPSATWMAHPVTYDQAVKAINLALEALRPSGDPNRITLGELLWSEGLAPGIWPRAGEVRAALMLHAVVNPDAAFAGLGPRAKPLAEKLGPELVDRIRAKDPDKIRRGLTEEVRGGVEEANR